MVEDLTPEERRARIEQILDALSDTAAWHTDAVFENAGAWFAEDAELFAELSGLYRAEGDEDTANFYALTAVAAIRNSLIVVPVSELPHERQAEARTAVRAITNGARLQARLWSSHARTTSWSCLPPGSRRVPRGRARRGRRHTVRRRARSPDRPSEGDDDVERWGSA